MEGSDQNLKGDADELINQICDGLAALLLLNVLDPDFKNHPTMTSETEEKVWDLFWLFQGVEAPDDFENSTIAHLHSCFDKGQDLAS